MARRILFDITTLARSSGHADGIVRTLRELARYAASHRPDVQFIFYDLDVDAPRLVKPEWAADLIDGSAKIDMSYFPDRLSGKKKLRERVPRPLKRFLLWIGRPRRQAYLTLERLRLRGGVRQRVAERLMPHLLTEKYQRELAMPGGGLRRLLPHDLAIDEIRTTTANDVLVLAGSDWLAIHQQLVRTAGDDRPDVVVLCYDIIPLLFPEFFSSHNRESFRACFYEVFPRASLVIFNAQQIMTDAHAYCERNGLTLKKSAIVRLGSDFNPIAPTNAQELPNGLRAGHYALFVSTIEPRKGHRLLFEVWKRLLAAGIPQAHGFKLVFLGKEGWLVEELMADLKAHPSVGDSLVMLSNVDDGLLARLYADAAFCLYPSLYEGFGLPIIEGFRYGKAVISSNGGALPETVGRFSPIVDARDEDAWFDIMGKWIQNPAIRKDYENLIRSEFRPQSWQAASREFFDVIDRTMDQSAGRP